MVRNPSSSLVDASIGAGNGRRLISRALDDDGDERQLEIGQQFLFDRERGIDTDREHEHGGQQNDTCPAK